MRRFAFVCLLAIAPASFAVPVVHDVTFNGVVGPSGAGTFIWDADTLRMTYFAWNFGGTLSGGISGYALAEPFFSYTRGAGLYETMTIIGGGPDVLPDVPAIPSMFQGGQMIGLFPGEGGFAHFGIGDANSYYITTTALGPVLRGFVTVTARTNVPEPGSLALLAFGLVGMVLARRRRAAHSSYMA